MKLRKNDLVVVMKGKDAGKRGRILRVEPARNRAVVEGVNFVKRHTRPGPRTPQGGIIQKEMPVSLSNLCYLCLKCDQPVRLGFRFDGSEKIRYCKKCGEPAETQK